MEDVLIFLLRGCRDKLAYFVSAVFEDLTDTAYQFRIGISPQSATNGTLQVLQLFLDKTDFGAGSRCRGRRELRPELRHLISMRVQFTPSLVRQMENAAVAVLLGSDVSCLSQELQGGVDNPWTGGILATGTLLQRFDDFVTMFRAVA